MSRNWKLEHDIMFVMRRERQLTIAQLAEKLGMTERSQVHAIEGCLVDLETEGWITFVWDDIRWKEPKV